MKNQYSRVTVPSEQGRGAIDPSDKMPGIKTKHFPSKGNELLLALPEIQTFLWPWVGGPFSWGIAKQDLAYPSVKINFHGISDIVIANLLFLVLDQTWMNWKWKKRLLPLSNVLVSYVAPNKKCFLSRFFWHFYCCAKGIYSFFCYEGLVTFSNIMKNIMTKIRIINPWPLFSFWLKNDYVANFFWCTKTCSNLASWGPQWTPVLFKVSFELIPISLRFHEKLS